MKNHQLATLIVFVAAYMMNPVRGLADEASALAVLAASDAALEAEAMACDELGRVGTAKAVPVLAALLADEQLHDYARDGLERITDPTAGKALLEALKTLKGSARVGVIVSLGDRGDEAAVPALAKIAKAKGQNAQATTAALNSLAHIATDDAGKAILAVLAQGDAEAKVFAARSALLAAEKMDKKAAAKMRKAVVSADVPAYIQKAAGK